MTICAVLGCSFRSCDKSKKQKALEKELKFPLSFFKFPTEPEKFRKWMNAVDSGGKFITKKSSICAMHFVDSDWKITPTPHTFPMLKPSAVPSIFPIIKKRSNEAHPSSIQQAKRKCVLSEINTTVLTNRREGLEEVHLSSSDATDVKIASASSKVCETLQSKTGLSSLPSAVNEIDQKPTVLKEMEAESSLSLSLILKDKNVKPIVALAQEAKAMENFTSPPSSLITSPVTQILNSVPHTKERTAITESCTPSADSFVSQQVGSSVSEFSQNTSSGMEEMLEVGVDESINEILKKIGSSSPPVSPRFLEFEEVSRSLEPGPEIFDAEVDQAINRMLEQIASLSQSGKSILNMSPLPVQEFFSSTTSHSDKKMLPSCVEDTNSSQNVSLASKWKSTEYFPKTLSGGFSPVSKPAETKNAQSKVIVICSDHQANDCSIVLPSKNPQLVELVPSPKPLCSESESIEFNDDNIFLNQYLNDITSSLINLTPEQLPNKQNQNTMKSPCNLPIPAQFQDPSFQRSPENLAAFYEKKLQAANRKIRALAQKARRYRKTKVKLINDLETLSIDMLVKRDIKCSCNKWKDLNHVEEEPPVFVSDDFTEKGSKRRVYYQPYIKSLTLMLHLCNPSAYKYVWEKFKSSLPHPKTVDKWYRSMSTNGISFTKEDLISFNIQRLQPKESKEKRRDVTEEKLGKLSTLCRVECEYKESNQEIQDLHEKVFPRREHDKTSVGSVNR